MEGIETTVRDLQKTTQELAGYVLSIAKHVYGKNGGAPYDEDEELPSEEGALEGLPPEAEVIDEDEELDAMPVMRSKARAGSRRLKARGTARRSKGYANSAKDAASEEDAPFDEGPDADIKGNEEIDPAGAVKDPLFGAGDRADETFNVRAAVQGIQAQLDSLVKALNAQPAPGARTIVKAVVPAIAAKAKGREAGAGEVLTREMQEQAKKASFTQLNRLREQVGDLPRFGFGG